MITASQILQISEKYVTRLKAGQDSVEIFVNPTTQELKDAAKDPFDAVCNGQVRFFADNNKREVYVWGSRILHSKLTNFLHLDTRVGLSQLSVFFGVAVVAGGRAEVLDSYNVNYNMTNAKNGVKDSILFLENLFSINWGWLEQYIKCSGYLKFKKEEFLRIKK